MLQTTSNIHSAILDNYCKMKTPYMIGGNGGPYDHIFTPCKNVGAYFSL